MISTSDQHSKFLMSSCTAVSQRAGDHLYGTRAGLHATHARRRFLCGDSPGCDGGPFWHAGAAGVHAQRVGQPRAAVRLDGLRAAVNAYGFLRQGLDLRFPPAPEPSETVAWTEEDEELLASSMDDMASMEIEDY